MVIGCSLAVDGSSALRNEPQLASAAWSQQALVSSSAGCLCSRREAGAVVSPQGETMRHFYDAIALEPEVFAGLDWQPIESYDVRPMDAIRRGRPLPAVLRAGDVWVFAVWNRGHGWM